MPDQVLIADRDSILESPTIQIIHIHTDSTHAGRGDHSDLEEFVTESYPIFLADKILSFLPRPPNVVEQTAIDVSAWSQASTLENDMENVSQVLNPLVPFVTPLRPQNTLSTSDEFQTAFTSRTITPGGTMFSPLSYPEESPSKVVALFVHTPSAIPSTLFSPPRAPASHSDAPASHGRGKGRGRGRRTVSPLPPAPLIEFEVTPRSIHGRLPRQTLVLRHCIEIEPLKDVFEWSKKCVEEGRIVSLEGWLVKFRDTERIRDVMEVCIMFGLIKLRDECMRMVERFQGTGEEVEAQF